MANSKSTALAGAAASNWQTRHNKREQKTIETAESYTPAVSGNWDSTPATQDAGLNELASRMKTLEGTTELLTTTVTVSNAEIQALNSAPKELIAAGGAGTLIVVQDVEFFHDYDTAAFDAITGDPTVEYATSGTDICTLPNDVLDNVSADAYAFCFSGVNAAVASVDLTSSLNKAVQLSNSNAIGVTGGAAGILKVRLRYRVVTVLT